MISIFAGSFDPITLGHVDLITRAAKLTERLVVVLANHPTKKYLLPLEMRMQLVQDALNHLNNVSVSALGSRILVDYAQEIGATTLFRGIRNGQDFDYEMTLANANKSIAPHIETVFLATSPHLQWISSSLVREFLLYRDKRFANIVPPNVVTALLEHEIMKQSPEF